MSQSIIPITPLHTPLATDLVSLAMQMSLYAGDMSPHFVRSVCDTLYDTAERVAHMERAAVAPPKPREA